MPRKRPPLVAIPGILASRRLRAPLVFDVRDFWPEAIAASGRLQSTLAIRMLGAVESFAYRMAAAITVVATQEPDPLLRASSAD